MADNENYIYTERDCDLIEGPFVVRPCKWHRSVKKRATALRRLLVRPTARIRERIVEYPLVIAAMAKLPTGSRVADLGGASSTLALQLVYLNHEVHVLDLRPCPLKHPRLVARQINAFDNDLPENYFQAISCISVIEHVGLDRYGGKTDGNSDRDMLQEMRRLIKPKGMLLLSAPYGTGHNPCIDGKPCGYRIYNKVELAELLGGFEVESLRFFVMDNGVWLEKNQDAADRVPTARPVNAIFFAQLCVPGNK